MKPYLQVPVLGLTENAENTIILEIAKPKDFSYAAGQYVFLDPAPGTIPRLPFSLSSAPHEPSLLICMRRSTSPFKTAIQGLKKGSLIDFYGPYGRLSLPKDSSPETVLLAGGIGVTPFRSLVLDALHHKSQRTLILFSANRNLQSAAFHEELAKIPDKNFHYIPVLETPDPSFHFEIGYLSAEIIKRHVASPLTANYIIVGPPKMVEVVSQLVKDMHIPDPQIVLERFTGYK